MHRVRFLSLLSWLIAFPLLPAVSAPAQIPPTQIKITVVDPQGAAVAGARVTLTQAADAHTLALQNTSAEGVALISAPAGGDFRVTVMAPGFAPQTNALGAGADTRVVLQVATAPRNVTVSATQTPIPAEESAVATAAFDGRDLVNMQPVAANEALRFLPGAVINTSGQRGGQASLFVRGGESRYNKVMVDGVPINEPGGFFDFGVVPMQEVERVELVRGAESILYGSDAMTSVVRFETSTGSTRRPELRFGADGGNYDTAHGFASLAGARGLFDYRLFGDSFSTAGRGPRDVSNDDYWNHSEGANLGLAFTPRAILRVHARHSTNRAGAQDVWSFNGAPLLAPDRDQRARQNNFLASVDLTISAPSAWQHRFSGYEYNHRRLNADTVPDRGCDFAKFIFRDCPFTTYLDFNRAGFTYQGEYTPRTWARSVFGYDFEDEHGDQRDLLFGGSTHGLRRNHAMYGEELLNWARVSLTAGLRYVHNESFGNKAVPRVSASWLALPTRGISSGTRLSFAYGEGIKAPDLLEAFGNPGFSILPNPHLKAEQNRSLEAGVQQSLAENRVALHATYFNNLFHNRIVFQSLGPPAFQSQFTNVDRVLAHGAELELDARLWRNLGLQSAYTYTATQVLRAPLSPASVGQPLLRRPRHLGSILFNYSGRRWGSELGASLVGRRPDSDFQGFGINHAAGYARVDVGGWLQLTRYATAYMNLENALNHSYNEVVGFPALGANVRAGVRFRLGGE